MSMMKNLFSGLGGTFMREARRPEASAMMVLGMGTAFYLLGISPYRGLSEETLKNDSPYARRYIGKYREYNRQLAAEHH